MHNFTKVIIFGILGSTSAQVLQSELLSIVNVADSIVVAKPARVSSQDNRPAVDLQVVRTLKGPAVDGTTLTVEADVGLAPGNIERGCGIWYLKVEKRTGKLEAIPQENGARLDAFWRRLTSCAAPLLQSYRADASPVDKVLSEMTESAERAEGRDYQAVPLYRTVLGSGSPIEEQIIQRFGTSRSPELRAVAVGLALGKGDARALERAEPDIGRAQSGETRMIYVMAISNFTNPEGAPVLGRLATKSVNADPALQYAASEALKLIHNPAALGFLYLLLDSPDKATRENAVAGYSLFRLGMPAALRGQAFDRALMETANPGRQIAAEDREGIHLGQFTSSGQEAELINFYKSWWPRNARRFSANGSPGSKR